MELSVDGVAADGSRAPPTPSGAVTAVEFIGAACAIQNRIQVPTSLPCLVLVKSSSPDCCSGPLARAGTLLLQWVQETSSNLEGPCKIPGNLKTLLRLPETLLPQERLF